MVDSAGQVKRSKRAIIKLAQQVIWLINTKWTGTTSKFTNRLYDKFYVQPSQSTAAFCQGTLFIFFLILLLILNDVTHEGFELICVF